MIAIMSDVIEVLAPIFTKEVAAPAGTALFHRGDDVRHLYAVRSGCVHLQRISEGGGTAVMQRADAGALLAESSIFATNYHCEAMVVADARLGRADIARVRQAIQADPGLHEALTRHLAGEVQRTRGRLEILSLRTVAERLDAWLAFNGALPPRGTWRAIADDIGVSPEAFYRELQRRRLNSSVANGSG
jgi:CRP-like cAMP-binding protein